MLPLAILFPVALEGPASWSFLSMAVGIGAAIVQAIGLARWPFAVPELARRYVATDAPDIDPVVAAAERRSIETTFVAIHRLFGVGIGEHLGYLLTGLWTLTIGWGIFEHEKFPVVFGWLSIPIGLAILIGSLEFVGPYEREGWPLAGRIVPVAYIAWSIWLIAMGIWLIFNHSPLPPGG